MKKLHPVIKNALKLVFATALLSACKPDEAAKKNSISLRLNIAKDSRLEMDFLMTQQVSNFINGQPMHTSQEMNFLVSARVKDMRNDTFYMENRYIYMSLEQESVYNDDTFSLVIDTDKPETLTRGNGMGAYYGKLVQLPYNTVMDASGKLISADIAEVTRAAGGAAFTDPYQDVFVYGVSFPRKSLKKGDRWEAEVQKQDKSGGIRGEISYTLTGWNDSIAYITMESKYQSMVTDSLKPGRLDMDQNGRFEIDRATGWVHSASLEQFMRMIDPNDPAGMIRVHSQIEINKQR